jgi:hypothetical protein
MLGGNGGIRLPLARQYRLKFWLIFATQSYDKSSCPEDAYPAIADAVNEINTKRLWCGGKTDLQCGRGKELKGIYH